MARKLGLPVVEELLGARPTLAHARRQLGGRDDGSAGAGEIGRIVAVGASVGVVLFASGEARHVVIEGGVVRRTRAEKCAPARDVPEAVRALADDVRVFASLREGDAVAFDDRGARARGTIVERCRYGVLVGVRDGRVLALGFRKVRPAAAGDC